MEVCRAKQWAIRGRTGNKVILREVFAKIVTWIEKFKQVGDVAVQYDPGHAALPWAAIRFVLQISVHDVQQYAAVLETVEQVSNTIGVCYIYEKLYLSKPVGPMLKIEESLKVLYMAILTALAKARRFYDSRTFRRTVKNLTHIEDKYLSLRENIKTKLADVKAVARLIDAENLKEAEEGVQKLSQLLIDLQNPIDRMETKLRDLQDGLDRARRREILSWISPIPYVNHHNEARHNRMKDTGNWFFIDDQLLEWSRSSSSSILWLHGGPGTGKTKLVSMLVDQLQDNFESGKVSNPVYFYCTRNPQEPARANPKNIFQSLLRQMSCLRPGSAILDATNSAYNRREEDDFASGEFSLTECKDLIIGLVEQRLSTTMVLDALDECDPEQLPDMLKALQDILQRSSGLVKIFVSSRDDQDIVWRLKDYPNLEINARKNHDDIVNFVQSEIEHRIRDRDLLKGGISAPLKAKIIDGLIQKAQGMFRWVVLSLDYLCGLDNAKLIEKRLGKLPPKLGELYDKMYRDRLDRLEGEERKISENAIRWLLCGQRSLNTKDFLYLVAFDVDKDMQPSKENLLKWCSNLVVLDESEDIFRFAHLSVREYLENTEDYAFLLNHAAVAEACISILTKDSDILEDKKYVRSIANASDDVDEIDEIIEIDAHQYACSYWALHSAASQDERQKDPLKKIFLDFTMSRGSQSNAFRRWIEFMHEVAKTGYYAEFKIRQMISIPVTPLFTACVWGFLDLFEECIDQISLKRSLKNMRGETALIVAASNGHFLICHSLLMEGPSYLDDALTAAAQNGHEKIIELLIERGAGLHALDFSRTAALEEACKNGHEKIVELLLQGGANVNSRDIVGMTPLAMACERGHKKIVALLVNKGANVNAFDEKKRTPLEMASRQGFESIVKLLIEKNADVNTSNWEQRTLLHIVSRRGYEPIVRLFIETKVDVNAFDWEQRTPLHMACQKGHEKIVELLLVSGADVNAYDQEMRTSLQWACVGGHERVVELLIEKNANVNAIDRTQMTPLLVASQYGYEKIVQLLIEGGADVNVCNSEKQTPLQWASIGGHEKIVELLIKKGANVNASEEECFDTVLIMASYYGREAIVERLIQNGADVNAVGGRLHQNALVEASSNGYEEIVKLLIDNGANVNAVEGRLHQNALVAASSNGYEEIVKLLIEKGANVNAVEGSRHKSALISASSKGHKKIVQLLIKNGADVNAVEGKRYKTALIAASSKGHKEIVQLLIENGADVNKFDGEQYKTALLAASSKGYGGIVKMLIQKGANVNSHPTYSGSALQATVSKEFPTVSLEEDTDIAESLRKRIDELIVNRDSRKKRERGGSRTKNRIGNGKGNGKLAEEDKKGHDKDTGEEKGEERGEDRGEERGEDEEEKGEGNEGEERGEEEG